MTEAQPPPALPAIFMAGRFRGFRLSAKMTCSPIFSYEVNIRYGWNAERELCSPTWIRYGEVALIDDVHSDQNVGVT